MTQEWTTKTFKTGNSVAIRLPKATGIREGEQFVVVHRDDGTLDIRPISTDAATLDALFGSFSPDFMAIGRGNTEQAERDWGDNLGASSGAA